MSQLTINCDPVIQVITFSNNIYMYLANSAIWIKIKPALARLYKFLLRFGSKCNFSFPETLNYAISLMETVAE